MLLVPAFIPSARTRRDTPVIIHQRVEILSVGRAGFENSGRLRRSLSKSQNEFPVDQK